MAALSVLLAGALLSSSALAKGGNYSATCGSIAKGISSASQVYYPLSLEYNQDLYHWMTSSEQRAACIVEVASNADVAVVMKTIAANRTPFAIKSGGHSSNQGFSSTTGVQIEMKRFNAVQLNAAKTAITVGMGNDWVDVYSALQGTGYNINGGRVQGPGIGGFTLGGGYNWKVNQYGLTIDTIQSLTLVLPNGTITQVDSTTPDLLFALRGGLNQFGVVTDVTFRALPQTDVYGGLAVYSSSNVQAVLDATLAFYNANTDPKSQVITTINGGATGTTALVLFFYDGPTKPAAFTPFNIIKPLISSVKSQTYESFSKAAPSQIGAGHRGAFNTMMTSKLTAAFHAAILNETKFYSALASKHSAMLISYDIEPFAPDYGQFATDSAFPHAGSPLPLNLYFSWSSAAQDTFWRNAMKTSVAYLTEVAKAEGIYDPQFAAYPNYALADFTAEQVYGATNLARLQKIKANVDPNRVMDLTGGFKV